MAILSISHEHDLLPWPWTFTWTFTLLRDMHGLNLWKSKLNGTIALAGFYSYRIIAWNLTTHRGADNLIFIGVPWHISHCWSLYISQGEQMYFRRNYSLNLIEGLSAQLISVNFLEVLLSFLLRLGSFKPLAYQF